MQTPTEMKTHQNTNLPLGCSASAGLRHILAALLFFMAAGSTGYAENADKLFEQLGDGQSVRVAFYSSNQLDSKFLNYYDTYEFEFRRAPTLVATIVRVETKWNDDKTERVETGRKTSLGTVNVTDDEAAGLDRLLQFYRSPPQDVFSTIVDRISITLRDREKVISDEHFVDETGQTLYTEGLTLFSDLTDKLLSNSKRMVLKSPDPKQEKEKAIAVAQQLAGYERFLKSFEVADATVGLVNAMPRSLFVKIEATHPALIDAVRWWNPLVDGKPSLSWDDFMKAYAAAESAMAKHPWLQEWKKLPVKQWKRSLQLDLLGVSFGEDSSFLEKYVIPVWHHAGFSGKPAYCIHARRYGTWRTIYFSDKDERALVVSSDSPEPESPSILDRVDVSWDFDGKAGEWSSRYAIIENDGRCHVETFVDEEAK